MFQAGFQEDDPTPRFRAFKGHDQARQPNLLVAGPAN